MGNAAPKTMRLEIGETIIVPPSYGGFTQRYVGLDEKKRPVFEVQAFDGKSVWFERNTTCQAVTALPIKAPPKLICLTTRG